MSLYRAATGEGAVSLPVLVLRRIPYLELQSQHPDPVAGGGVPAAPGHYTAPAPGLGAGPGPVAGF